jgi:hypothetical protein
VSQFHVIQTLRHFLNSFILKYSQYWPKHKSIFEPPQGIPPSRGEVGHSNMLILGRLPPNVHPYSHPYPQKKKIENIVQELLANCAIHPSTSPYSSQVIVVLKKEVTWHMCPNF